MGVLTQGAIAAKARIAILARRGEARRGAYLSPNYCWIIDIDAPFFHQTLNIKCAASRMEIDFVG
jgi:hypothetical protein